MCACSVIHHRRRRRSSQHHVVPGWYQHVPDEDRGRTGSVKVHRLSGVRGARRRRGLAPPPSSPPPHPHTHTPHAHTAHTHSLMEPALTTDPNCLWTGSSCIIGAWPPRFMSINHSRQSRGGAPRPRLLSCVLSYEGTQIRPLDVNNGSLRHAAISATSAFIHLFIYFIN